jgi:hypothetical protein
MCGHVDLDGPATRPAGAVTVLPTQDLQSLTDRYPPSTTFWLAPGVHHLPDGEYSQIQPKNDSTYIGAPGAVIDGRHTNLYAFGGDARGVRLAHFTVQNFGSGGDNQNEGVVNHDAAPGWLMSYLTVQHNAGAGVFLGDENVLERSCLRANGQYGFSAYSDSGVRRVALRHNEIADNNTDAWEDRQPGCGCSGGGKFWDTRDAEVVQNYVHDNRGVGVWADTNNAGFLVANNYFADNDAEGLMYETSYNLAVLRNTFVRNGLVKGPQNPGFPTPAIYLSESGSDERVGTAHGSSLEVADNRFVDNWGGVVAWENADRFVGSPANTSTGVTTLVDVGATVARCSDPEALRRKPLVDDCRWKTQNVQVHDNTFEFSASALGRNCTLSKMCGFSGVFSNYGTYPEWSPYQGRRVERDITFSQGNRWYDNAYIGSWRFMVLEVGNIVSWETWRAAPYRQDQGSTFRR